MVQSKSNVIYLNSEDNTSSYI